MAHKFRGNFPESTDDDRGDDLNDFDSYLRNREAQWQVPVSEMKVTDTSTLDKDVAGATESSSSDSSSTETDVEEQQHAVSVSARNAEELATKLKLHEHAIVGTYVTEEKVPFTQEGIDAEWQKMFIQSRQIGVTECTAEQIIERFHGLDRTVFLIRAQQQGLRLALEEVLATKSYADREKLLEMDRKFKAKANRAASGSTKQKVAREKSGQTLAKASKGKSKGAKGADTFKMLGFDKVTTEKNLKDQNLLDESTQAYVNKLFA